MYNYVDVILILNCKTRIAGILECRNIHIVLREWLNSLGKCIDSATVLYVRNKQVIFKITFIVSCQG